MIFPSPPPRLLSPRVGVKVGAVKKLVGLGALAVAVLRAQPLLLDPAFPAAPGPDDWVRSVAVQPDGRILIAGDFTHVGGEPRPGLARLRADGSLDRSFQPTVTGPVRRVRPAPDGSLLLAGYYTNASRTWPGVARLRPDGTFDEGFVLPAVQPAGVGFGQLHPAGGGRFWVTGGFTNQGGQPVAGLARLLGDGSVDPTFRPPFEPGQRVSEILPLPDGRLWVAGSFTNLGGVRGFRLARLQADGAVDASFQSPLGPENSVSQLQLLTDGRVLARWSGALGGELFPRRLVRLLPEGALDPAYPPTFQWGKAFSAGLILTRAAPDGSAWVAGTFVALNGLPRPGLARLLPEGTADPCTDPGLGVSGLVLDADFAPDGGLVIGGTFADVEGQPRPYLARLRPAGACEPAVLEGGRSEVRVSEDSRRVGLSVSRRGGADRESRVRFEVIEGTARAGEDFVPRSGTLTLAAGARSASLEIELLVDPLPEGGPSLRSWPVDYEAALVRLNRDGSPAADLTAAGGWVAAPGDPTALRAVLALPEGKVLVGGRFLVAGGLPGRAVTRLFADGRPDPAFDAGEARNWRANPPDPAEAWPAEVRVLVPWPEGGWLAGGDFQEMDGVAQPYLVRLLPETAGQEPGIRLVLATNQVAEGAGWFTGQVRRRGDASAPAPVRLRTLPGEALPGVDFEPLDLRLELAAGEWVRPFAVRLHDDSRVGPARTFRLELSEPSPGLTVLEAAEQAVTIRDDDVNVEFAGATFTGSEDDGGGYMRLVRFGVPGPEVTVHLRAGDQTWTRVLPAAPEGGRQTNEVWLSWPDDTAFPGPQHLPLSLEVTAGASPGEQIQATWVVVDNDYSLAAARGVAGRVNALAPAPGGGLWVAGEFTAVHGVPQRHLARLTADLSVDPAFDPGAGPEGAVTALLALETGGVVSAGTFDEVAGRPRRRLARLLDNGAPDPDFDAGAGPIWSGSGLEAQPGRILALAAAPEGGLWVGGQFTLFDHEPAVGLVRLDRHGRVDRRVRTPLVPGMQSPWPPTRQAGWTLVRALLADPDGGVVAGGLLNVPASPTATITYGLLRLGSDGARDPGFTALSPGRAGLEIEALARDPAGRLWAGGRLSSQVLRPGGDWLYLARFLPDGRPDESFQLQGLPLLTVIESWVRHILPWPDGSAWVLMDYLERTDRGLFLHRSLLGRVATDGRWDAAFPALHATGSGFAGGRPPPQPGDLDYGDYAGGVLPLSSPALLAIQAEAGGRVVVGGSFTGLNDQPRRRLARLDPGGTLTGLFQLRAGPAAGGVRVELPPDVPWPYQVEASVDLRRWHVLGTNAAPWEGWTLDLPVTEPRQFLRAVQLP